MSHKPAMNPRRYPKESRMEPKLCRYCRRLVSSKKSKAKGVCARCDRLARVKKITQSIPQVGPQVRRDRQDATLPAGPVLFFRTRGTADPVEQARRRPVTQG